MAIPTDGRQHGTKSTSDSPIKQTEAQKNSAGTSGEQHVTQEVQKITEEYLPGPSGQHHIAKAKEKRHHGEYLPGLLVQHHVPKEERHYTGEYFPGPSGQHHVAQEDHHLTGEYLLERDLVGLHDIPSAHHQHKHRPPFHPPPRHPRSPFPFHSFANPKYPPHFNSIGPHARFPRPPPRHHFAPHSPLPNHLLGGIHHSPPPPPPRHHTPSPDSSVPHCPFNFFQKSQ